MQAILLNDLPNFFSYSSWLSMEFPIQFMGQVFFLLSFCPFSFLFLYLSPAFRPFFEIRLQPFRLNWYFLIKWENLLVFQSISVANDVYSVIIKTHERRGKKKLAGTAEMVQARKKQRDVNMGDFLSMHIIANQLKRGRVKIDWTCAWNVWSTAIASRSIDDSTYAIRYDCEKVFPCRATSTPSQLFFGRVCAFFPLFGSFIFIHFVQNLANKKCSTASILHGACERVSKRDRKRVFGANTTCWCYNWFFFHFHSVGFPYFSFLCRTSTYTGTRPTAHFIEFSYATTNAPKRNWRGKMLMVKKTACI